MLPLLPLQLLRNPKASNNNNNNNSSSLQHSPHPL
jgi:hypothetical protein